MDMEELVERAQSGDTDAFVELMESQMTNLYKAARSLPQCQVMNSKTDKKIPLSRY